MRQSYETLLYLTYVGKCGPLLPNAMEWMRMSGINLSGKCYISGIIFFQIYILSEMYDSLLWFVPIICSHYSIRKYNYRLDMILNMPFKVEHISI